MKKLGNNSNTGVNVEPKEDERGLLPSSIASVRSSSLGFTPNSPLVSEEMQLDYLASILVAIYLEQKQNGNK